jgi:cytochrome d ubiquinol oxidase subunit I
VTEIGRQPYLVYGVLKTADAASAVPAPMIGATLVMYLALYVVLTVSYITVLFYLARRAEEDDRRRAPVAMPVPGSAE